METSIKVTGARIHNLKNIDIEIPKGKLTVITGVSGSGKSSLAFDTLYEEGKRRYLMFSNTVFDDVPTYAESITGLSPTVAVEQRITRQSNPRSTVGTRTKIGNLLAAFFAMYGIRPAEHDDGMPLSMEMFQKNSAKGMCVRCLGKGKAVSVNEEILLGDESRAIVDVFLTIMRGMHVTIDGTDRTRNYHGGKFATYCKEVGLSPTQPLNSLNEDERQLFLYGGKYTDYFDGLVSWAINHYHWMMGHKRFNGWITTSGCVVESACRRCGGTGLGTQASFTTIDGKNITALERMYISELYLFLQQSTLADTMLAKRIAINLKCLMDVGLHHLALTRPLPTLSGGEVQRLFLASYIIAEMDSIIFIFDEPTIGLHEVEKQKLIDIIQAIIKRGNTVVAVEHDIGFMQAADYIIDLGPYAGDYGGERIFQGSYQEFMACSGSQTAPYLSGALSLPKKTAYKSVNNTKMLRLSRCSIHNLRNISVDIPLGLMVGVAGVSGSGKSSLVNDTLVPKLRELLQNKFVDYNEEDETETETTPVLGVKIRGVEHIKKCIIVDQKPIGRTSKSYTATYTGVFDKIRALFAQASGLPPGFFTVNGKGGCRPCGGTGERNFHVGEGNFMCVACEACGGTGFIEEALAVKLDGKTIRDVLDMTVTAALDFFAEKSNAITKMLHTWERVGMGYIKLGQNTKTVSGGEAQRIKLAKELGKSIRVKDNVYILDEPTTGLSFSDSAKLIALLQELVDNGNTVIITEHDPALLTNCDYVIEMGPGGGSDGGYVLATGTPAELKRNKTSIIGRYLL